MSITPTEVARETARRMRRLGLQNGEEIRRLRSEAGVSLATLGTTTGLSKSHLARIEANKVQPSLEALTSIGVALGADLSLRYYPGSGPRLHDRFQAPMVETLLGAIDPRWRVRLEVPVHRPVRGVIDIVLEDPSQSVTIAGEVNSELRRLEQQVRWSMAKADALGIRLADEDAGAAGHVVSRLLVLRSTSATREIARRYERTLAAAYPARVCDVVAALTSPATRWPGSGIAWMYLHGSKATLMAFPPRYVSLGR
jgi:transcriptional regulator with XRE-family HTH domain